MEKSVNAWLYIRGEELSDNRTIGKLLTDFYSGYIQTDTSDIGQYRTGTTHLSMYSFFIREGWTGFRCRVPPGLRESLS